MVAQKYVILTIVMVWLLEFSVLISTGTAFIVINGIRRRFWPRIL